MKKILIIMILIFAGIVFRAEAQYGFGTNTPNPQAILDMNDPTKGVLIPRVALVATDDASPFTLPVQPSMLVYNTVSSGNPGVEVTPGFYYWNGTAWIRIAVTGDIVAPPANTGDITSSTLSIAGGDNALQNNLTINIADNTVGIEKLSGGTGNEGKVLTVNASGTPVWTPGMKWFYMPGVPVNTQTISNNLNVNLYNEYIAQFGTPVAVSSGAPAQIPTLPSATDLYYYVTGVDASITINSINASGEMSYNVLSNSTACSYINIVFVIK